MNDEQHMKLALSAWGLLSVALLAIMIMFAMKCQKELQPFRWKPVFLSCSVSLLLKT